jgi:NitT/TauT family transport system permease protein
MSIFPNLWSFRRPLAQGPRTVLHVLSFVLPLVAWCVVSYVPGVFHPKMRVLDAGDSLVCAPGELVERDFFEMENSSLAAAGGKLMQGQAANPAYLPAPHQVAVALVKAFQTPPRREGEKWFHESIQHSMKIVFSGFLFASLVGVPLGILCGSYGFFRYLFEPVTEFIRYFPAPVFATLAVAILGINDAPKIAIIVIGTLFQQILMVAGTTRTADLALVEAAETLGASGRRVLLRVIVPSVLPKLYRDLRILLGWAWTYLIVAEVVGATSGISWFITQQAKYRNFGEVYAAIIVIGCIGLGCDMLLALAGRRLFSWEARA